MNENKLKRLRKKEEKGKKTKTTIERKKDQSNIFSELGPL